jgi:PAS domain S-box-containing protein
MVTEASQYSVLIVEDNQDLVLGLQDLLHHDGYAVTAVGTVAAALELVRAHRFNAILLDLGLPDGDGLEVLKESQRLDPSLPVVIVTAHISSDRTVGSLAQGAYAYLTKPYDREELRHTLRRAIGVKELAVKVQRTEHLLSQSEERFRSLVDSAADAIVLADHCGRILSWNLSASTLFGYADEEAIGKPLTLLMPERYRQAHVQGLARMESTGKSRAIGFVIEVHGLKKDGTEFPIELSLATWKSMEHSFYSGIIRDISDRKKVERAMQDSQERFRQLAEHISEVFWMTDLAKQQMLYVSSGYEKIWGRSCESLYASPQSWLDAVHTEDRARVRDAALRKQTVGTYDEQYRILRPDGAIRWISDRAFPIRDSSGIAYRIVGLAGDITDQMCVQQLLRDSEERLELVIQGSHDGFWDGQVLSGEPWSSPSTPVWWSPRVKTMLGYTDEEFPDVLESWASRLHPADAGRVFAALTAHIEHHDPYDVEYRLLTKAGTYGWFQARGQAIWDETGRMTRMAGSLRDVTDRKQAEDALRRNEQLLQTVADNTTAIIYVKDIDGRFLFINRSFEQLFHLTTQQIIGHTNYEIFPREIADAFRANDLQVLERNRTVEYEELAPHEDGLHTYLSIKFPLCDHTGKPYATCGISTDITERKQTEEAFRQSEERFRTMFTQAPIGMALIDSLTGQIHEANSKFAQISGRTKDELCGLDWMSITHPDDVQADLNNMAKLNAGEIAGFQMEKRYIRPDGTVAWINLTVAPIKVKEHVGPRHLAMIEDITERKRDEEIRQEMQMALAHAMPGISRLDSGGRYLSVNKMYARALGYDPSELIGRGWSHTVSPAYRPHAEAAYETMLRKGTGEFEAIAVRKDGSTFWKQVLMVKILDRDGCHVGHHCFMRDITERKSIEHNLRSLTEQLHLALTSAEVGTWNWDLQTDHIYWSSQVDRFLDLSEGARPRTKYDWLALVYPEDRESMMRVMRQAMDQLGADVAFEHRVLEPDGSFKRCIWTGEIIRDQDGKALHILGTVRAT